MKKRDVAWMKANPDSQENTFVDFSRSLPEVKGRDVLVQIEAVSINPIDIKTRKKAIEPSDTPLVLGSDGYGEIIKIGEGVKTFKVGEKVFFAGSRKRDGSYTNYELVDERLLGHAPKTMTAEEAVSLPLTFVTAYEIAFERLHYSKEMKRRRVLIYNGAGGVGSALIQLLKDFPVEMIVTASKEESLSWVKKLGATHIINHRLPLIPQLQKLGIEEVEDFIDLHGISGHEDELVDLMALRGRFVSVAEVDQKFPLLAFKAKQLSFLWENMSLRTLYELPDMDVQGQIVENLSKRIDEGKIQSTTTKVLHGITAQTIQQAHQEIEKQQMVGKLVLTSK